MESLRKVAVLTMDVEDWYHLDYFLGSDCDRSRTVLDGLDAYLEVLEQYHLPATLFVVGELVRQLSTRLASLSGLGHEVGAHSWEHVRPVTQTAERFREDARRTKTVLEDAIQGAVEGYRAPSYGMDRARVEVLRELGYGYDSSRIEFAANRRYGQVDMTGFDEIARGIYRRQDFYEFEISTLATLGRRIPVAGGGYFRLLPWRLMRWWVSRYLATHSYYVFYIHPYEFSRVAPLPVPRSASWGYRWRYTHGHRRVAERFGWLVKELRRNGFEFATFRQLRQRLGTAPDAVTAPPSPPDLGPRARIG